MQNALKQWLSNSKALLHKRLPWFLAIIVGLFIIFFSDYNLATGSGNLCIILFIAANTYVPAKWLRFMFNFQNVGNYFNVYLGYHCILNIVAFLVAVFHCYVSNWVNFWLKVGVVLMGWLVLGGFLLKFKYTPKIKKSIYFLHSQQFVFFLLLYALLKGHYAI